METIEFEARLFASIEGKGWTFVTLPEEASARLPTRGRVAVAGTVNGFPFRGSAFPDGRGSHQIMVNATTRDGAGVGAGDLARFAIAPASDEVEVVVPVDLEQALAGSPAAAGRFAAITSKARAEWVAWIEGARMPATRRRRLARTVELLLAGKRRPSD